MNCEERRVDDGLGGAAHRGLVRRGLGRRRSPPPRAGRARTRRRRRRTGRPGSSRAGGPAAAGAGRSAVPTCHGLSLDALPAGEDEAPVRRRGGADGGEGRRRLVEEHHAELAHREVERRRARAGRLHVHLHEAHVRTTGLLGPRCRANSSRGAEMSSPDDLTVGRHGIGQGDRQGAAAAPDVADPLTRAGVGRLEEVGRHGVGEPLPLGPRRRPPGRRSTSWSPPRWPRRHGSRDRYGSRPCASASSSCPRTAGATPAASGSGRTTSASPRRGPTTTSAGAACPTARGTPRCRCWPRRRGSPRACASAPSWPHRTSATR